MVRGWAEPQDGLWSSRPDSAQSFPAARLQFALEGLVEDLWISLPLGPEDILLYFLVKASAGFFRLRGLLSSRSGRACAV